MYAVIDIGSNTIRLSIYRKTKNNVTQVLNKKVMAGLVGYIDDNNNMNQYGVTLAIDTLNSFKKILTNIKISETFIFATASLREIKNTKEVLLAILEKTGFQIDVLSGEQEGFFAFNGATKFKELDEGIVIDIGGGSSEVVTYKDKQVIEAVSIPFGSLNFYNAHVKEILPTNKEIKKMRKNAKKIINEYLNDNEVDLMCGVGGSIRACNKLSKKIYGNGKDYLDLNDIQQIISELEINRISTMQSILKIIPERIHTIIPGLILFEAIVKKFKPKVITVSSYGVREGYLYNKIYD